MSEIGIYRSDLTGLSYLHFGAKIYFISTNYHISAISGVLADGDHADLFKKKNFEIRELLVLTYIFTYK